MSLNDEKKNLSKRFLRLKRSHTTALGKLRDDIKRRGYHITNDDKKRDELRTRVLLIREQWNDVNDKLKKLGVDTKKLK